MQPEIRRLLVGVRFRPGFWTSGGVVRVSSHALDLRYFVLSGRLTVPLDRVRAVQPGLFSLSAPVPALRIDYVGISDNRHSVWISSYRSLRPVVDRIREGTPASVAPVVWYPPLLLWILPSLAPAVFLATFLRGFGFETACYLGFAFLFVNHLIYPVLLRERFAAVRGWLNRRRLPYQDNN